MSTQEHVERLADWARFPMQWRGSDDAVTWTDWEVLSELTAKVPAFFFYQARIWRDHCWYVTPISSHGTEWAE